MSVPQEQTTSYNELQLRMELIQERRKLLQTQLLLLHYQEKEITAAMVSSETPEIKSP